MEGSDCATGLNILSIRDFGFNYVFCMNVTSERENSKRKAGSTKLRDNE
jgi:hypothetical protein